MDTGDQKFFVGGVSLVSKRIKNTLNAMPQESIENLIQLSRILDFAGFDSISLIYKYGIQNDLSVRFERINKKYRELPISIELDAEILLRARNNNLLQDVFMVGALEAMLSVCAKYKLDDTVFREERAKYRDIPKTVEECESLDRLLIEVS